MVLARSSKWWHRSKSASSTSEISSKSRLAMASLLEGHSLSAGISSGVPEGRNSKRIMSYLV